MSYSTPIKEADDANHTLLLCFRDVSDIHMTYTNGLLNSDRLRTVSGLVFFQQSLWDKSNPSSYSIEVRIQKSSVSIIPLTSPRLIATFIRGKMGMFIKDTNLLILFCRGVKSHIFTLCICYWPVTRRNPVFNFVRNNLLGAHGKITVRHIHTR